MRTEPMEKPDAALANVLARIILACLIAVGGKSLNLMRLSDLASESASGGGAGSCANAVRREMPAMAAAAPLASALCNRIRRVSQDALVAMSGIGENSMQAPVRHSVYTASPHAGKPSRRAVTWFDKAGRQAR